MFGSGLHTHIYGIATLKSSNFAKVYHNLPCSGHGLRLQHFRKNEECGVVEELETIDENLRYDFNYQVHACGSLHS